MDFPDTTQEEIWATIRAANDAWTRGDPNELRKHFHPQMVAITPVDRLRLDGAEVCVAGWKTFAESCRIESWREIDPLIRVFADSAVVSYYYEIIFWIGGQRVEQAGRDLFFLVRQEGVWWIVADQFSGYP
jgi:hypothetical protein